MSVEVKFTTNRALVQKQLDSAIEQALETIGMQVQNYAVMNIEKPKPHKNGIVRPNVDTGNLVGSIDHKPEGDRTMVIGTNVEYAPYVELGTQKTLAYPFLKPALLDHQTEWQQILSEYLQNI